MPINNLQGDVVGFGARTLGDDKPKYVNSSESDVYHKSRLLYNLDRSQDAILREGWVCVVEGYFDVLRAWEAGIHNVVASCGTAFTRHQVRLLKRFSDRIIIAYDGDNAGSAAAEKAAEGLSDEQIPLLYATMPFGSDPDSFIKERGRQEFLEILNSAK